MRRLQTQRLVKKAFDNLPSGLCFFDKRGMLVLSNILMNKIVLEITKKDLQVEEDLISFLSEEKIVTEDGKVWRFSRSIIEDPYGNQYTEYIASNITEIVKVKEDLRKKNEEQRNLMERMTNINKNIVAIAREEEILSMKMRVHSEVGWFLQSIRQFYLNQCSLEGKADIIKDIKMITKSLRGEIEKEESNHLSELISTAKNAGVEVKIEGYIPDDKKIQSIIITAIRESVTNTFYHAEGSELYVNISNQKTQVFVSIRNNGKAPKSDIIEGGGLGSLRKLVEKNGGQMETRTLPEFELCLSLPHLEEEIS